MYNILKDYDISNRYAYDMGLLYRDLYNFINEQFPNGHIEFSSDQRIVFRIQDLDYYINSEFPGFSLYNLQLILKNLDIPNFVCAVVSNMPNFEKYTKMVRDVVRPDDVPMRAITNIISAPFTMESIPRDVSVNIDQIKFPFISTNRLERFQRTFFVAKLFEKNLHNKGLVSYHNIPPSNDLPTDLATFNNTAYQNNNLTFLYTRPFATYNSENLVQKPNNIELIKSFKSKVSSYCNFKDETNIGNKNHAMCYDHRVLQPAFLYAGVETTVKYPEVFQSGITHRGIAAKRPFVIFGVQGSLKYLQQQGFKTFSQWWDESYDEEPNIEKRADMIIDILVKISSLPIEELQNLCGQMSEVLEHNFDLLSNKFMDIEYQEFDRVLDKQFIGYND